jgi:drug/metabolite transporter (DMT)-like permease
VGEGLTIGKRDKPSKTIYIELIVFAGVFGVVAEALNISGPNMATMTNTFATVSGVLLGLFFVVKTQERERDPGVTQLLLFSILISLVSSLFSFDPSYVQNGTSKVDFGIAASFFEASTVYFVIKTELLGPLTTKNKGLKD